MTAFMWAILAACIWGVVPLLEKIGLSKVDALAGLFYRCIGVLIGWIILSTLILKPNQIKSVDLRSALWLILGGFLASIVAQLAFYQGLKVGEISRVVPISGIYPLIAFILGVVILGEVFSWVKLSGIILIILGVWMLRIG
jgi:transporter family protein